METNQLANTILFRHMTEHELEAALEALQAVERTYLKDQTIFHMGEPTDQMGIVLEGSVRIENIDLWGNRTILSHIGRGQVFAETYAMVTPEPLLVDAVANEPCRVLMLRIGTLSKGRQVPDLWRLKLLSNLLEISMRKNLVLSGRIFHTSVKGIRPRVMAYLNSVSLQKNAREFDIPFDRQQMADYLNVERTALSKELSRMQRDGIISFRKNHFRLMKTDH